MADLYILKQIDSIEGTIANGASDTSISFTNVTHGYYCVINNDDSSNAFSVKLKIDGMTTDSAAITIKAGESLELNNLDLLSIKMSNSSGANIDYRILLMGD